MKTGVCFGFAGIPTRIAKGNPMNLYLRLIHFLSPAMILLSKNMHLSIFDFYAYFCQQPATTNLSYSVSTMKD